MKFMPKKAKATIPFMPKIEKAPGKFMPKIAKAPGKLMGRKLPPRPKKETGYLVLLGDGEVFFSYIAPGDASSSLPAPTAEQLRDVNGDGEVNISDVMEVVSTVLYGVAIPDIELSTGSETMEVLVGFSFVVDVTDGSGNIEVECSDPDKLEVTLVGLSLSLRPKGIGNFVVTVKDKETGKTKEIQIIVEEPQLSCPDDHHPHMIDLGLPSGTKWACCNVDPTPSKQGPSNNGGYYAWGETEEKDVYDWSTYVHCDGSQETCHDLGESISGTRYDVAHVKWEGKWHMPTETQKYELLNKCSYQWTSINGNWGMMFVGPNGNAIFLPAGSAIGSQNWDSFSPVGKYWTGTVRSSMGFAAYLRFYEGYPGYYDAGWYRSVGMLVRPVYSESMPLAVGRTAVEVELGRNATVEVTAGNGNYEVSSSNAEVAVASVSGTVVNIVGTGVGTATVTVTDTATGQTKAFSVTVSSPIKVESDGVSFGAVLPNTVTTREITVTNSSASDAAITVSTDAPFSLEGGTASRSYNLAANTSTTVKVVFTTNAVGDYFGNLNIAYGDATLKVPMQASCVNSLDEQLVIERKYWLEYGDEYCYPNMTLTFDNNTTLQVGYYYTLYWDDQYLEEPFTGIHITSDQNDWNVAPVVVGQWVREKVVIKNDGNVKYYMNSELMGEQQFGQLNLANATSVSLTFSPYGWWTGHKHYMDDFGIYTSDESFVDNFNDGEINLDFWQTPINTSGVREEDGVIKLEQLETDQDFNLRTRTVTLNFGSGGSSSTLSCPDDHHPHMIDLGLPSGTKWSCCNVGADTPEGYGGYYAWGETSEKSEYDDDNYEFFEGYEPWEDGDWVENFPIYKNIGRDIAGTEYDVARCMSASWVMPSWDQMEELYENCASEWTVVNGIYGAKFTSNFNGSSIFLPAAGCYENYSLNGIGRNGYYWSSTQFIDDVYYANKQENRLLTPASLGPAKPRFAQAIPIVLDAFYLNFDSSLDWELQTMEVGSRSKGRSVRPVSSASSASHLQLSISDDFPLMEGETAEIEILSGSGNYRVEFNNYDGELGGGLEEEENIIYITGLLWGEAVVTVTDLGTGESVSFTVSVYQGPPPFSLSEESLTLDQGETATVEAYDGSGNYTVESSDEHVATAEIDADGNIIITGNSNGTATITVYDVEFGGSASLEVTVTKNGDGPAIDYPL